MTIRIKICCTTYKNICTYQKKVVPLQHEKVNKVSNICSSCMAYCTNSHIINLLYGGEFANVNFTQSKLAKSLHLKIGAKVIKKTNINKLNYKIMTHYNVLFLYRNKKRYQFEKSFPLRSMAEIYAEKVMNESVYMKHLIKDYKITTSPNKRY